MAGPKRVPVYKRGISMPEVVRDLLEWGAGSGEEMFHWLTEQGGATPEQARRTMMCLNDALARSR